MPIFNLVSTYKICKKPKVMFGAIHPSVAVAASTYQVLEIAFNGGTQPMNASALFWSFEPWGYLSFVSTSSSVHQTKEQCFVAWALAPQRGRRWSWGNRKPVWAIRRFFVVLGPNPIANPTRSLHPSICICISDPLELGGPFRLRREEFLTWTWRP